MGYASRNNPVAIEAKSNKLTPYTIIKNQELIRMNPEYAFKKGLLTYEQYKELESLNYRKRRQSVTDQLDK